MGITVDSVNKNLIVLTSSTAYILNLPLKSSFEDSLKSKVNLPSNPKIREMTLLLPSSLMYLDDTDHIYFKQDILNSDPAFKVKQDPLANATIIGSSNNGSDRDWIVIRGIDDYSGYIYRIFNWTSLRNSSAVNPNNEVILGIDSPFDQAMFYNNSIVFVEKAFGISGNSGRFMFYKTDLGGFVRSGLYDLN